MDQLVFSLLILIAPNHIRIGIDPSFTIGQSTRLKKKTESGESILKTKVMTLDLETFRLNYYILDTKLKSKLGWTKVWPDFPLIIKHHTNIHFVLT